MIIEHTKQRIELEKELETLEGKIQYAKMRANKIKMNKLIVQKSYLIDKIREYKEILESENGIKY